MRPVMWVLFYCLSVFPMILVFFAIQYTKAKTANPRLWSNVSDLERWETKAKAWCEAVMFAVIWPLGLVIVGVSFIFSTEGFGIPKEVRKALTRKKNRETIEQWEKEQYGETQDPK